MNRVRVNDVSLAVEDRGDGPVVCFSHGLLLSSEMYAAQIGSLSAGYRCIAWDHRGQGRSDVPAGRIVTIDQCYEDAVALIEQLDCGAVHFAGLSMGGFVGLRLAARRPDLVRSLILIDSAGDSEPAANVSKYRRLNLVARLFGVSGRLADRVMPIMFGTTFLNDPDREIERRRWRTRLMQNRRSIYKAVNGVIERDGVMDELPRVAAPTLVLHGSEDVAIAAERAHRTCDAIPGARFVEIPAAGHSSTIEQPETMTTLIREFIRSAPVESR
jgi:pimeloyl-ACP methyl ester carboxylesterase